MPHVMTEEQIGFVLLIAGLREERWLTEDDVEGIAIHVGAIREGVYRPGAATALAIECIRVAKARGPEPSRQDVMQRRIVELQRQIAAIGQVSADIEAGVEINARDIQLEAQARAQGDAALRQDIAVEAEARIFGDNAEKNRAVEEEGAIRREQANANLALLQQQQNLQTQVAGNDVDIAANRVSIQAAQRQIGDNRAAIGVLRANQFAVRARHYPTTIPNIAAIQGNHAILMDQARQDLLFDAHQGADAINRLQIVERNTGTVLHDQAWLYSGDDWLIDYNISAEEAQNIGLTGSPEFFEVRVAFANRAGHVAFSNWIAVGIGDEAPFPATRGDVSAVQANVNRIQQVAGDNGEAIKSLQDGQVTQNTAIQSNADRIQTLENNPAPSALTQAQQIGLMDFVPDHSEIVYPNGGEVAALTRTINWLIGGGAALTGDIWFQGQINGVPIIDRTKWANPVSIAFEISADDAATLAPNVEGNLDMRLDWHDAANGGNLVRTVRRSVGLTELPAVPPRATFTRTNIKSASQPDVQPFPSRTNLSEKILPGRLYEVVTGGGRWLAYSPDGLNDIWLIRTSAHSISLQNGREFIQLVTPDQVAEFNRLS